ncbi:transposase, partial [Wenyingzhuangia sp. 1_MG-2023]|nr:transposase [Wenyingzhuangia sp. 1_MG-2023]
LFKQYPEIQKAYQLVQGLREIFNLKTTLQIAYTKLAHWYKQVEKSGFNQFKSIVNTITLNYRSILNYFIIRSTNAGADSFNAIIKAFRAQF